MLIYSILRYTKNNISKLEIVLYLLDYCNLEQWVNGTLNNTVIASPSLHITWKTVARTELLSNKFLRKWHFKKTKAYILHQI